MDKSPVKTKYASPILHSLDPNINSYFDEAAGDCNNHHRTPNNVTAINSDLESLNFHDEVDNRGSKSVLLLDESENLKVKSESSFLKLLKIEPTKRIKVVSIFGNTGQGKSYTMNHVFFNGEEVFKTSASQNSCTMGVWAKYDPNLNVICLDTEGLLGVSKNEYQRTRLLLKILAISDIIIYRTGEPRLSSDMYTFLGAASKSYKEHFSGVLQRVLLNSSNQLEGAGLGPGVIIFHETHRTETFHNIAGVNQSPEDIIRSNFVKLKESFDSFSFIKYIGIKTAETTSFEELKRALRIELESTDIRSPREAKYIYLMLKSINEKFQHPISDEGPHLYLAAFFTCPEKCLSCKSGCSLSMGHKDEGLPHSTPQECQFQHEYQNVIYLCNKCYRNGKKTVVKLDTQSMKDGALTAYINYVWSGDVIECPLCGEIYRSRKYWYGNKSPEDGAVRVEIVHVWPGERAHILSANTAQRVVDGVTMISETVANISYEPANMIRNWVCNKIAPPYWKRNEDITECKKCKTPLVLTSQKHHCRACGDGFCQDCSSKEQPVPSRGWTFDVRVCDDCYCEVPPSLTHATDGVENRARMITETISSSLSVVTSALEVPRDYIKRSARPSYWVPDEQCTTCAVCEKPFGLLLKLHHCRECGKGVCDNCSKSRKPVPQREWFSPVRICDACSN